MQSLLHKVLCELEPGESVRFSKQNPTSIAVQVDRMGGTLDEPRRFASEMTSTLDAVEHARLDILHDLAERQLAALRDNPSELELPMVDRDLATEG